MKKLDPKKYFNGEYEFMLGVGNISQLPNPYYSEVAFLGASNVGKSSLVNAILSQKMAVVSSTPGRTKQLNFFKISDRFIMVDMPGYGYAKANKEHIEKWQKTSFEYLTKRPNLKRVFLLIDPIKGLKESDIEMINVFNTLAVSFQIVFTKIDKLNREELRIAQEKIATLSRKWAAFYEGFIFTSSSKGYGIEDLQNAILNSL